MGNIHINQNLELDQPILQYLDFHDLVDLLKFNQAFFARADRPQRIGLLSTPGTWHNPAKRLAARDGNGKRQPGYKLLHDLDADEITLQSWVMADADSPTRWNDENSVQPRVCIVSSIRALSQALFTDEATSIFIEQARHSGVSRAAGTPGSGRHKTTNTLSAISPDTLCAIAISRGSGSHSNLSPAGTHLRVDLGTLLSGVIVPPNASERYMQLITRLVQERVWVTVARARPPVAITNLSTLVKSFARAMPTAF